MSNYSTMVKRISNEVQRGRLDDEIRLCIVDAIEDLSSEQDRFNEDEWSFLTVAGIGLYTWKQVLTDTLGFYLSNPGGAILVTSGGTVGSSKSLPHDWLGPIGQVWMHIDDDDNNYQELDQHGYEAGDRIRYRAGTSTSYPEDCYWVPEGLRLSPPPTTAGHRISGRYQKRLFVPTGSWDGSSWTFDSGNVTSEWFRVDEAERLVRAKAKYLLYERYIDDPTNMEISRRAAEELLIDRRHDDSVQRATNQIEPWGFY